MLWPSKNGPISLSDMNDDHFLNAWRIVRERLNNDPLPESTRPYTQSDKWDKLFSAEWEIRLLKKEAKRREQFEFLLSQKEIIERRLQNYSDLY